MDSYFRSVVRKLYKSKILYQIMEEYSFMKEGTLTRFIVDLFSPKKSGTTLRVQGIAKALGIKKAKRSRRDFLAGITELTLKDVEGAVLVLSDLRNVLYKRTGPYAAEAYAIKDKCFWRTDEQYSALVRTYRPNRTR